MADKIKDWSKVVTAYKPVWATGFGKVACSEQLNLPVKGCRIVERTSTGFCPQRLNLYTGHWNPESSEQGLAPVALISCTS